jgi:hypothetical protein
MNASLEGFNDYFDGEVRLIILKGLAAEDSGRLSDAMLMHVLETFAVTRSRDYLKTQLRWLERESGSVILREAG